MNNFARTANNRERLQQKSLFKRTIQPIVIIIDVIKDEYDYYKWPKSSGAGKIKPFIKRGKTVKLESVKVYFNFRYGQYHKHIHRYFNKAVLPGKIIHDVKTNEYWKVIKN